MKQLYIDHDLPELLRIIYAFLEPPYTCILQPTFMPSSSAASLACISRYFSKLRRDQYKCTYHKKGTFAGKKYPIHHECHLVRITRRRQICRTHCKAYPILAAVAKQSKIDTLRRWRRHYKINMTTHILGYPSAYMHFKTPHIARFAPHLLPNIEFTKSCCNGIGWKFRWRSNVNEYDSSDDSDASSLDDSFAEEINN